MAPVLPLHLRPPSCCLLRVQLMRIPRQVASPGGGPLRRFQLILQILSKHGRRAQTQRPWFSALWEGAESGGKSNNRTEKQQNTRAPPAPTGTHTQANNLERFAIYTITATKCSGNAVAIPAPATPLSPGHMKLRRKFLRESH